VKTGMKKSKKPIARDRLPRVRVRQLRNSEKKKKKCQDGDSAQEGGTKEKRKGLCGGETFKRFV